MHAPPFRSIVRYFYTQARFYKTVWSGSHLLKRHLRLWKTVTYIFSVLALQYTNISNLMQSIFH